MRASYAGRHLRREHIHGKSGRRFGIEEHEGFRVDLVEPVDIDRLHRRAEFLVMLPPDHKCRRVARATPTLAISDALQRLNRYKLFLLVDVDNASTIHSDDALGVPGNGVLVDESFSDGRDRSAIYMCLFQQQATTGAPSDPRTCRSPLRALSDAAWRSTERA